MMPTSSTLQASSASPWHWTFLAAVAIGGALGAVCRFSGNAAISSVLGSEFPVGILLINVLGGFLMGLLQGAIKRSGKPHAMVAALLGTGFLGGFTTFSTFALDTFTLYHAGQMFLSSLNVILNACLCIAAVGAGYKMMLKKTA